MGDAHAGHDAGRANRARADADLDRIRAHLHQRTRRSAGGDIAAHHVDMRIVLFDPAHPVDHAFAVAVRGIDHDGVHACAHQRFHTLLSALAHPDRCAHAQLALGVARGVGEAGLFGDVFHRDQAFELEGFVNHQQALQSVLVQERLGFDKGGAVRHRHQALAGRHDVADRLVVARFKTQIAPGDDTHHFAAVAHRESGYAQLLGQCHDFAHSEMGGDDHRITQHAGLVALDLGHLRSLLGNREVFVDDAHATLLRDGNRQARLGHRVHGGRHQGQIQGDVAGEQSGQRGVLGEDLGVRGDQQHIVEGQRFAEEAHGESSKKSIVPTGFSVELLQYPALAPGRLLANRPAVLAPWRTKRSRRATLGSTVSGR